MNPQLAKLLKVVAALLVATLSACQQGEVADSDAEAKKQHSVTIKEFTRFKADPTKDFGKVNVYDLNPAEACVVHGGRKLILAKPAVLSAQDDTHIRVVLADGESAGLCTFKIGFLYGPHVYGTEWDKVKKSLGKETTTSPRRTADVPTGNGTKNYNTDYNKDAARRLAYWATVEVANGARRAYPNCYEAVSNAMINAGVMSNGQFVSYVDTYYKASAYMFAEWAERNPNQLASVGLKRLYVSPRQAPVGSIVVYGRGVCGSNPDHGHIEVITVQGSSAAHFAYSSKPAYCDDTQYTYVYVPL